MTLFGLKFGFVCAWYDCWVGAFYDQDKRRLYLMIPFVGITIERPRPGADMSLFYTINELRAMEFGWPLPAYKPTLAQQIVLPTCPYCGDGEHDGDCFING